MFRIEVTGIEGITELNRKIGRNLPVVNQKTLSEIADFMSLSMKVKAPKWTGNLASQITVRPVSQSEFNITMPEYGMYLQEGIPHVVDPMLLTEWVADKMGMSLPLATHVARRLGEKIETVGPNRNPFVDAALAEVKPHIHGILKRNLDAALKNR